MSSSGASNELRSRRGLTVAASISSALVETGRISVAEVCLGSTEVVDSGLAERLSRA